MLHMLEEEIPPRVANRSSNELKIRVYRSNSVQYAAIHYDRRSKSWFTPIKDLAKVHMNTLLTERSCRLIELF